MNILQKTFSELSAKELYELLKSRAEIFVVEQNCVYQDLDDIDYRALHLYSQDESGRVSAYLRVFEKTDEPGTAQIGRVLSLRHGEGLGGAILHAGIAAAKEMPGIHEIYIEAQKYAVGFYEREGFFVCSDEFLEDGIPHVQMRLKWS